MSMQLSLYFFDVYLWASSTRICVFLRQLFKIILDHMAQEPIEREYVGWVVTFYSCHPRSRLRAVLSSSSWICAFFTLLSPMKHQKPQYSLKACWILWAIITFQTAASCSVPNFVDNSWQSFHFIRRRRGKHSKWILEREKKKKTCAFFLWKKK